MPEGTRLRQIWSHSNNEGPEKLGAGHCLYLAEYMPTVDGMAG